MKATALFLAASALAAVSAGAYDGYGYDPRPASSYNNTISGAAHIGYDSRYNKVAVSEGAAGSPPF